MVLVNYVAEVVLQCLHRKYIRAKYGRKINSAPRNGIESEPPYATGIERKENQLEEDDEVTLNIDNFYTERN